MTQEKGARVMARSEGPGYACKLNNDRNTQEIRVTGLKKEMFEGNRFSLDMWLYPEGDKTSYPLLMQLNPPGSANANNFTFRVDDQLPYLLLFRENGIKRIGCAHSPLKIENNQWNHLFITYDGFVLKFYIQGILAGSEEVLNESVFSSLAKENPCIVGGYINGLIHSLRLYSREIAEEDFEKYIYEDAYDAVQMPYMVCFLRGNFQNQRVDNLCGGSVEAEFYGSGCVVQATGTWPAFEGEEEEMDGSLKIEKVLKMEVEILSLTFKNVLPLRHVIGVEKNNIPKRERVRALRKNEEEESVIPMWEIIKPPHWEKEKEGKPAAYLMEEVEKSPQVAAKIKIRPSVIVRAALSDKVLTETSKWTIMKSEKQISNINELNLEGELNLSTEGVVRGEKTNEIGMDNVKELKEIADKLSLSEENVGKLKEYLINHSETADGVEISISDFSGVIPFLNETFDGGIKVKLTGSNTSKATHVFKELKNEGSVCEIGESELILRAQPDSFSGGSDFHYSLLQRNEDNYVWTYEIEQVLGSSVGFDLKGGTNETPMLIYTLPEKPGTPICIEEGNTEDEVKRNEQNYPILEFIQLLSTDGGDKVEITSLKEGRSDPNPLLYPMFYIWQNKRLKYTESARKTAYYMKEAAAFDGEVYVRIIDIKRFLLEYNKNNFPCFAESSMYAVILGYSSLLYGKENILLCCIQKAGSQKEPLSTRRKTAQGWGPGESTIYHSDCHMAVEYTGQLYDVSFSLNEFSGMLGQLDFMDTEYIHYFTNKNDSKSYRKWVFQDETKSFITEKIPINNMNSFSYIVISPYLARPSDTNEDTGKKFE